MIKYINYILFILIGLFIFSCSDDDNKVRITIPAGQEHQIRVRFKTSDFNTVRSLTEDEEYYVEQVWVAQFDESGHRVPNTKDGIAYAYPTNGIFMVTATTSGANEHKLYFVTNMATDPFDGITEEADFLAKSFDAADLILSDKLVMQGDCKTVLSGDVSTREILVYIERLMAKLEIIVQADLSKLGEFQNKKIAVKSVMVGGAAQNMKMGDESKVVLSSDTYNLPDTVFTAPDPSSSSSFFIYKTPIYYILENMHGNMGAEGTKPNEKNNFAPKESGNDLATYLLVTVDMDNGEKQGIVQYKIYLGDNDKNNFSIVRNTHYTITVTINGSTASDLDVRIDTNKLATLQILKPDGTPATNRDSETIPLLAEDTFWDGGGYAINSGNTKWSFNVTQGSAWTKVKYEKDGSMTSGSTSGNDGDSGGKFQVVLEPNLTANNRICTIEFSVTIDGIEYTRIWKIEQKANTNIISVPNVVFIESKPGYYAIPVRAAIGVEWKCTSSERTYFKVHDHITSSGVKKGETGFVDDGNGLIILDVTENTGTDPSKHREGKLTISYTSSGDTKTITITVRQLADKSTYSGTIYNSQSSTLPILEELLLSNTSMKWAINDLNSKYLEDPTLLPNTDSRIDGQKNTYNIFQKLDRNLVINMPKGGYTMAGFTAVTPAGACAMINDSFDPNAIDGGLSNTSSLEWYLPANYEGIWTTTSNLLFNAPRGGNRMFWSSTVEKSGDRYGAYTMREVDVTLLQSSIEAAAYIRCVRKVNPAPSITYPYMKIDTYGKPIIVTKENISGIDHGYTAVSSPPSGVTTSTRVEYPLRFTQKNPDGTPGFGLDGSGPINPSENTLSPKFQVAIEDVPNTNKWLAASGWNATATDFSNPKTGCAAYNEGGYTNWRLPTNAELRVMLLLGTGVNRAGLIPSPGSDSFAAVSNFKDMNGYYFTGRDYVTSTESGVRVYYLYVDANNIKGSAVAKTSSYRTRCVRDIK